MRYVVVTTLSVVVYQRHGMSNTEVALYSRRLYLPWILTLQLLIGAALALEVLVKIDPVFGRKAAESFC